MINVTKITIIDSFALRIWFSDGTDGICDLLLLLKKFPFATFLDEAHFLQVRVEDGSLVWPGGINIAVESLYASVHGLPKPDTLEIAQENEKVMAERKTFSKMDQMTPAHWPPFFRRFFYGFWLCGQFIVSLWCILIMGYQPIWRKDDTVYCHRCLKELIINFLS